MGLGLPGREPAAPARGHGSTPRHVSFDGSVPCPFGPEWGGYAWAPAYSTRCLHRALTGKLDTSSQEIVCTVHRGLADVDQEANEYAGQDDDPEGRTDLDEQAMEAIRETSERSW